MPPIELRGVQADCGGNSAGTGCTISTAQDVYEFDIVAPGYETIRVRHDLQETRCGGACCCCGYEPSTLVFTLVPVAATDGGTDAGNGDGGTCSGTAFNCCVNGCGNSGTQKAVCSNGAWTCTAGVAETTCAGGTCSGMLPPSSLKVCADYDAGVCIDSCDPGEVCFTQVACNPGTDGGIGGCRYYGTPADAGVGDNRCHRRCSGTPCAQGETCVADSFYGCHDINQRTNICL